jgi:hypothetical protein
MVKGIASCGVVAFALLGAGAAVCQSGRGSLPDAPSAVAGEAQRSNAFVEDARLPFNVGGTNVGAMGDTGFSMRQEGLFFSARSAVRQKDPEAILRKYLNPSSSRQALSNHSASGESLLGRGTQAAVRTVVTRNEAGKGRLNTSYLLRTLTAVAKDSASTPYWRRHVTDTFGDFGSTVGSDAGMNLWHEFGPSIGHVLKNVTPGFVSRMEARMGRR